MNLQTLLQLAGVQKEEQDVLRIVDGDLERVDIVDLGANGYGEEGFLVKKGRKMLGKMTIKDGKFVFVTKEKDEDEKPATVKISTAVKDAVEAKVTELQEMLKGAEIDDDAEGIPDEVQRILGVKKEADPEVKEDEEAAADEPKATDVPLPANLAALTKSIEEIAGDNADSEEIQAIVATLMGALSPEHQAVAAVSKRFDSEMAALKKQNTKLEETLKALTQSVATAGFTIPDGSQHPAPAPTNNAPSKFSALPGVDLSTVGGDNDDFGIR
jgi:hypothetical protein